MPPSISRSQAMNGNVAVTSQPFSVASSLKRKRPPKIEIPNVLREIETDAVKPTSRDCQDDAVCSTGYGVGVYSVKGKKLFMEDTHKFVSSSHADKGFFGVYDGHGGNKAAEFVAENLHSNVFEMLEKCEGNTTKEEAVKAGFLKTDEEFLKQGKDSGAFCVAALIEGKEIVISNVGDCRAVLSKGGKAVALTKDHRASQEDERKRIEDKGGYVELHRGAWRVHGVLSVSRSIGDAHLKDWVLAEPDTRIIQLTTDMEYLVLASDGLWDEVGNQEAVDVVMRSCSSDKKLGFRQDVGKVNKNEFGHVTTPPPKLRRVSLVKRKKQTGQSPSHSKSSDSWKESENYFGSENDSPPSKARRSSSVNQMKLKTQNPDQENSNNRKKTSVCDGLVDACKELVKLAENRGSLDDITVMIIDLKHFKN